MKDVNVKALLRTMLTAMRSHLDALEEDINREHTDPKRQVWNQEHAALSVCLTMRGLTELAANFCKANELNIAQLENADRQIDEHLQVMGKRYAAKTLQDLLAQVPDDNPNKSVLHKLLSSLLEHSGEDNNDETKH